jgi:hypothetical protein
MTPAASVMKTLSAVCSSALDELHEQCWFAGHERASGALLSTRLSSVIVQPDSAARRHARPR